MLAALAKPQRGPCLPAPRQPDTLQAHAEQIAKVNVCMVLVTLCKFWLNLLQTVWTADSSAAARRLPSPKGPRLPAPRQHDTLRAHAEHIAKVNACMVLVTPYKFRLNMLQQGQDCRLLGSSATPVKPNGAVYTLRAHAARIAKVNVCMVLVAPLQVLVKYVAQGQDCRLLGSSVTPTKPKRGSSTACHRVSQATRHLWPSGTANASPDTCTYCT